MLPVWTSSCVEYQSVSAICFKSLNQVRKKFFPQPIIKRWSWLQWKLEVIDNCKFAMTKSVNVPPYTQQDLWMRDVFLVPGSYQTLKLIAVVLGGDWLIIVTVRNGQIRECPSIHSTRSSLDEVHLLYNIWHRFSVRSWWPRVLWQSVTLWLVNRGAIRALGYNRCVTGRRSRDENHAIRFRQSEENHSQVWDTQPTRGVSDELARGCERWHPLVPGRRYGKKSSL